MQRSMPNRRIMSEFREGRYRRASNELPLYRAREKASTSLSCVLLSRAGRAAMPAVGR